MGRFQAGRLQVDRAFEVMRVYDVDCFWRQQLFITGVSLMAMGARLVIGQSFWVGIGVYVSACALGSIAMHRLGAMHRNSLDLRRVYANQRAALAEICGVKRELSLPEMYWRMPCLIKTTRWILAAWNLAIVWLVARALLERFHLGALVGVK